MMFSVEETRKIMGEANKKYNDVELEEIINILTVLADIALDSVLAKRKEKQNGRS